ncbi:helix-turn-helix domain-containing protein, partial [Bacillus velezensis]|uniref:helix-turn-helix domain-containing protein n=1 Tax=Bacillus velezensis TaxID=492670 RepID=UPI00398C0DD2
MIIHNECGVVKLIKSNLKPILDEKNISIRKLSNDIDHGFNTVRKLYHDVLERYQRELLVKVFTSVDI